MAAAGKGHLEIVCLLANGYINIHKRTRPDWMGFVLAAGKGHCNVVKFLLSKGMNINEQTPLGWTALMSAAYHGRKEMVVWLLQHDADSSLRNNEKESAYDLAKERGYNDIAALLD